jgi:hypothetical protein
MPSLTESLRRVLTLKGARTAALIDVATGMIIESAGHADEDLPVAAASLAREAQLTRSAARSGQPDGNELDEICMVTASRLHVTRVLGQDDAEGLLLFVELDRGRANMALASREIAELAPVILA